MSIYKSINIVFNCKKCKKQNNFIDGLKISGMRPENCKDFEIKFIKNCEDNEVEYTISFTCKKCKHEGMTKFAFKKNETNNTEPIYKEFTCCEANVIIQALLLFDNEDNEEENIIEEKMKIIRENNNNINYPQNNFRNIGQNQNINNMDNSNMMNMNYNMQYLNNYNGLNHINNRYMNNQLNGMVNPNINLPIQNPMFNSYNNINGMNNMNNMMINMPLNNNIMNNMNVSNNNMNNINLNNNNINFCHSWNLNNNLEFNNNNVGLNPQNRFQMKTSYKITIQFEQTELKFEKNISINKSIKEVVDEIAKENFEVQAFAKNIRKHMVSCNGEYFDYRKTLEEIIKEKGNIFSTENCVILIPNVNTVVC